MRYGFLHLGIGPLQHAIIENTRSIKRLELPIHPRLTVLYGRNACGKTTVLDALAVGLSALGRLLYPKDGSRRSGHSLLRQEWPKGDAAPHVALYCRTTLTGSQLSWDETLLRDETEASRTAAASGLGVGALAKQLETTLTAIGEGQGQWDTLPVFACYGVERAVEEQARRGAVLLSDLPRLSATAGALEATSRFQPAVDWFRTMEDRERREREKRGDANYRSPALDAVRGAIERVLPGCSHPRISEPPERLVVDYVRVDGETEVLDLAQLSDGYRTHLALVLDLARRMVQANPPPPEPQPGFNWGVATSALVLIDEVDLHLHPSWQQRVLPDLLAAFPGAQFIVTTHSDQVLSSVPTDSQVWQLVSTKNGLEIHPPEVPLSGARSDQILSVGMGVEVRSASDWSEALKTYLHFVEQGESESPEALALRSQLNKLRPDDPDLLRVDIRVRRKLLMG